MEENKFYCTTCGEPLVDVPGKDIAQCQNPKCAMKGLNCYTVDGLPLKEGDMPHTEYYAYHGNGNGVMVKDYGASCGRCSVESHTQKPNSLEQEGGAPTSG